MGNMRADGIRETVEYSEFYGIDAYVAMLEARDSVLETLNGFPKSGDGELGTIDHVMSRLKSPASMADKMRRRGIEVDGAKALDELTDAVGVRVVCSFVDDVYAVRDWMEDADGLVVRCVKDYMANPKPSGYRSLHLIVDVATSVRSVPVEVQIRTIAQDFWAALEHQIGYKHLDGHEDLIRRELRRCADEIASTDLSMQTIRDIIERQGEEDGRC